MNGWVAYRHSEKSRKDSPCFCIVIVQGSKVCSVSGLELERREHQVEHRRENDMDLGAGSINLLRFRVYLLPKQSTVCCWGVVLRGVIIQTKKHQTNPKL